MVTATSNLALKLKILAFDLEYMQNTEMLRQQNRTVDLIMRRAVTLQQFFPLTKPWATKNMLCHSSKACTLRKMFLSSTAT